jgi:hypothetical protein
VSDDELDSRLVSVPFTFPDVTGRHVFVLGLGGGCDVITAFAVSRLLPPALRVVYGNTKTDNVGPIERVTPHVVRVASTPPEHGRKVKGCGSAAIDHGVPRDAWGSPWIVLLGGDSAEADLPGEIGTLGFDLIIGVDAGGDSIVTKRGRAPRGRDQRMLAVLLRTGVPVLHVVVGPGCDGESRTEDLRDALAARLHAGAYRGCFPVAPILPVLREQSRGLSESRTPRIVLAAADGRLDRTATGRVVVPRGCRPEVPPSWLAHAFVFEPAGPQRPLP